MFRLVLVILLLLASLLTVFRAPEFHIWYVSILVTEFPWIFIIIDVLLLCWCLASDRYRIFSVLLCCISLAFFLSPVVRAKGIAKHLDEDINNAFGIAKQPEKNDDPVFSLSKMITGINSPQIVPQVITYSSSPEVLTLDYYNVKGNSKKPCVIIIHGGSWAGGDSKQLPELNTWLVKRGYNAASLNYRLAPKYLFPAPVEDVKTAMDYLKSNAEELNIDTNNFILLGRSAGGQIALKAAYSFNDKSIKGVINFYGPADMVWGYAQPANKLVLDSRKVMEDYLGGTYAQVPVQYHSSSGTEAVTQHSLPTLMIHGKNDPLVAYEHEIRLSKKLEESRVQHFLLSLPWATHGCDYTLNGPSGQLCTYAIERFLKVIVN